MNFPIFPKEASTTAAQTDHLYFILLGLSVFVLALVFLPMIFFLFKYRRGKKANRVASTFARNENRSHLDNHSHAHRDGNFCVGRKSIF